MGPSGILRRAAFVENVAEWPQESLPTSDCFVSRVAKTTNEPIDPPLSGSRCRHGVKLRRTQPERIGSDRASLGPRPPPYSAGRLSGRSPALV
jgi:hypothetical protein